MKKVIIPLIVSAFLSVSLVSRAQGEYDDPPPAPEPGDPGVPIDGGLSLLLAAGVAYGAKKGYDMNKRKKDLHDNQQ